MNCEALVSQSAHQVGMDKNNEPQRGSTTNQSQGILDIICVTPLA